MQRACFPAFLVLLAALPAAAAEGWTSYVNGRFGYVVAVPPGFSVTAEPENGDGLTYGSADGRAQLLVFGSNLIDGGFADEIRSRIGFAAADGWAVTYQKVGDGRASYSGSKGDRIVYVRAVALCKAAAGFAQIEYDKADLARFDAIVSRLAKGLQPAEGCAAGPSAP